MRHSKSLVDEVNSLDEVITKERNWKKDITTEFNEDL